MHAAEADSVSPKWKRRGVLLSVWLQYFWAWGAFYGSTVFVNVFIDVFHVNLAYGTWFLSGSAGFAHFLQAFASSFYNAVSTSTVVITAMVLQCCGYCLIYVANRMWIVVVIYTIFMGTSFGLLGGSIQTRVAARHFKQKVGMALGVATSGGSAGAILLPVIYQQVINWLGWKHSLFFIAGLCFTMLTVALLLLRYGERKRDAGAPRTAHKPVGPHAPVPTHLSVPTDIQTLSLTSNHTNETYASLRSDYTSLRSERTDVTIETPYDVEVVGKRQEQDYTLRQTFKWGLGIPAYRLLLIGMPIVMLGYWIPFTFLPPYVKSRGIDDDSVAVMIAITGIGSLCGRVCLGLLSDVVGGLPLAILCLVAKGGLVVGLDFLKGETTLSLYAFVIGFFAGGIFSLVPKFLAEVGGSTRLPHLYGAAVGISSLGTFLGSPLVGTLISHHGFLDGFLAAASALAVGSIALIAAAVSHHRAIHRKRGAVEVRVERIRRRLLSEHA